MSYKLKIKVTRDILEKSKMCGIDKTVLYPWLVKKYSLIVL